MLSKSLTGSSVKLWRPLDQRQENLAENRPYFSSSRHKIELHGSRSLTDGKPDGHFGLHTRKENKPWCVIDLGVDCALDEIRVYNPDSHSGRSRMLTVSVSTDALSWSIVHRPPRGGLVFGGVNEGKPMRIKLGGKRSRFVRLALAGKGTLSLDQVEVSGSPYVDLSVSSELTRWKSTQCPNVNETNGLFLLQRVTAELERMGFAPFLVFGTLLGAVREGRFISHDTDIDLGLILEKSAANRRKKSQTGPNWFNFLCKRLERYEILPVRDRGNLKSLWFKTEYLDLYVFSRADSTGDWRCGGYSIAPEEVGTFSRCELLGSNFRVPSEKELYLRNRYGLDWQVPRIGHHAKS